MCKGENFLPFIEMVVWLNDPFGMLTKFFTDLSVSLYKFLGAENLGFHYEIAGDVQGFGLGQFIVQSMIPIGLDEYPGGRVDFQISKSFDRFEFNPLLVQ